MSAYTSTIVNLIKLENNEDIWYAANIELVDQEEWEKRVDRYKEVLTVGQMVQITRGDGILDLTTAKGRAQAKLEALLGRNEVRSVAEGEEETVFEKAKSTGPAKFGGQPINHVILRQVPRGGTTADFRTFLSTYIGPQVNPDCTSLWPLVKVGSIHHSWEPLFQEGNDWLNLLDYRHGLQGQEGAGPEDHDVVQQLFPEVNNIAAREEDLKGVMGEDDYDQSIETPVALRMRERAYTKLILRMSHSNGYMDAVSRELESRKQELVAENGNDHFHELSAAVKDAYGKWACERRLECMGQLMKDSIKSWKKDATDLAIDADYRDLMTHGRHRAEESAMPSHNAWMETPNNGGLHWTQIRAAMQQGRWGRFESDRADIDMNAELAQPLLIEILDKWNHIFGKTLLQHLDILKLELGIVFNRQIRELANGLEDAGLEVVSNRIDVNVGELNIAEDDAYAIGRISQHLKIHAELSLQEYLNSRIEKLTAAHHALRGVLVAKIQEGMAPGYNAAAAAAKASETATAATTATAAADEATAAAAAAQATVAAAETADEVAAAVAAAAAAEERAAAAVAKAAAAELSAATAAAAVYQLSMDPLLTEGPKRAIEHEMRRHITENINAIFIQAEEAVSTSLRDLLSAISDGAESMVSNLIKEWRAELEKLWGMQQRVESDNEIEGPTLRCTIM